MLSLPWKIVKCIIGLSLLGGGVVLYQKYKNSTLVTSSKEAVYKEFSLLKTSLSPSPVQEKEKKEKKKGTWERVSGNVDKAWEFAINGVDVTFTIGKAFVILVGCYGIFKLYKFIQS